MSEAAPQIQLEKLQIVARPRPHWEALDLGVLIARRWYGLLLASWLCVALPVFALLWLVIPDHPIWSILIVWWLKPVYERIPLSILSTAIFGATPSLNQALRGGRQAIWPGMLRILSYRRLSPNRSFEAPVWVLERVSGDVRGKRFSVLQSRAGSGAFWLTVLAVHVEGFLVLGVVTGVYLFIPANMEVDWWGMLLNGSNSQQDWLVNLLTLAVMGAVAPIYVASGFALYLNRRIELEAWDLELGFRRLAQRAAAASAVLLVAAFVTLILPSAQAESLSAGQQSAGQQSAGQQWYGPDPPMEVLSQGRRQSRQAAYEVLAGEDFNQQRTLKYPKFLHDWFTRENPDDKRRDPDTSWIGSWIELVALVAEVLLWVGVALLLIWIVRRSRLLQFIGGSRRAKPNQPLQEIFGLDVSAESLPDAAEIGGHASALWDSGARREALSLIYRGALVALMHRFACELREADTEGDCLVKARALLSRSGARYFTALTRTWQLAAYAHCLPSEGSFVELCEQFQGAFAVGTAEAEDA